MGKCLTVTEGQCEAARPAVSYSYGLRGLNSSSNPKCAESQQTATKIVLDGLYLHTPAALCLGWWQCTLAGHKPWVRLSTVGLSVWDRKLQPLLQLVVLTTCSTESLTTTSKC